MAKYFFDQLEKGKARRDAQQAQNQAVLANLIKMKQADDAQIRKLSNDRYMQEYGYDFQDTNREDTQGFETGERVGGQNWKTGEREGSENWQTGERVGGQSWRTSERLGEQGWKTSEREAAENWKTGERIGSEMHAVDMQEDDQSWKTSEREAEQTWRTNERIGTQEYDASKQKKAQKHDLVKLDKQAGYSMAELDKKLNAEEKNLVTRLNHDMETLVIKENGLNKREIKRLSQDLHKFYKTNDWKVQAEKTKRENNILDAIFALDMESKQKAKDFKFIANPFLLGKMTNMLGMNYKEGAVLEKVEGNLPALVEAVSIARNLPDVKADGLSGVFGDTMVDPRKSGLISVLQETIDHLDRQEGTLNPTPWDNESDATKSKVDLLRNEYQSLMQMVEIPQAPVDPSVYLDRIRP
jgi:hypothetical protein